MARRRGSRRKRRELRQARQQPSPSDHARRRRKRHGNGHAAHGEPATPEIIPSETINEIDSPTDEQLELAFTETDDEPAEEIAADYAAVDEDDGIAAETPVGEPDLEPDPEPSVEPVLEDPIAVITEPADDEPALAAAATRATQTIPAAAETSETKSRGAGRITRWTGPVVLVLLLAVLAGGLMIRDMARGQPVWWHPVANNDETRAEALVVENAWLSQLSLRRSADQTNDTAHTDAVVRETGHSSTSATSPTPSPPADADTLTTDHSRPLAYRSDPWSVAMSEQQANAWLASRLPEWVENSGELTGWPDEVTDLQVDFDAPYLRIGVRVIDKDGRARVLSATLRPELRGDGSLWLEADWVHVGRLSIPADWVLGEAEARADELLPAGLRDLPESRAFFRRLAGEAPVVERPLWRLPDGRQVRLIALQAGHDKLIVTCRTELR